MTLRFKYCPSFADYWRLNRSVMLRQIKKMLWIAGALLLVYVLSPFVLRGPNDGKSPLDFYRMSWPLLIQPALVVFICSSTYFATKKRWASSAEIRGEREYEIGPEGIRIRGTGVEGFMDWSHFVTARFYQGLFVITTAQGLIHYFPESVVPDNAQLRSILRQHIAKADI